MLTHSVVFKLKHKPNSPEETLFLSKAQKLASLASVQDFKILRQISQKNHYTFALSMNFASQQAYDAYNTHPEHIAFVENVWKAEVEDFMELDYTLYS